MKCNRREFIKKTGGSLAALAIAGKAFSLAAPAGGKKPNIILVLTDDQHWTDTSVRMMKSRKDSRSYVYKTPNLERLAREGVVFSSGYAPAPVCSPTRDSILYGKTPTRLHHSILLGKANCGPDALTTPRAIKAADGSYVTAHFGKWGCSPKSPEAAGYDVSDGDTDNWHGDWQKKDGQKAPLPADDPKRMFSVTKRANDFMQQQADRSRPFFMQISHYAVHVHHHALQKTIDKYLKAGNDESSALYAAMIENLDTALGLLLDKIDALGIADNTYVIYTADNGGGFRNKGPLKGGKASLWEGGIRVPTIARGPGIKAGTYCDVPVVGWDFLPTFADLAGNEKPLPKDLDGASLRSVFENGNKGKVDRPMEPLIFHYPWFDSVPMSTIRLGDYKLVKDLNTNQVHLYNLANDLQESKDLSKSMPGLTRKLHSQLNDYLDEVDAEKIADLRKDRKKFLFAGIAKCKSQIEKLNQKMKSAVTEAEKADLQEKIAQQKRQIRNHQGALDRVEKSLHMRAW